MDKQPDQPAPGARPAKPAEKPVDDALRVLRERAKELNCLYAVEELLREPSSDISRLFTAVVDTIPRGWQWEPICRARIEYEGAVYQPRDFVAVGHVLRSALHVQRDEVGAVEVCYIEAAPEADEGPFLLDERRLLNTIAERLGHFLAHRRLQRALQDLAGSRGSQSGGEWEVVLDFLHRTDKRLYLRVARKMLNHLAWGGVHEAVDLLRSSDLSAVPMQEELEDENRPIGKRTPDPLNVAQEAFRIARQTLRSDEILGCIRTWIKEDKSTFLVNAIEARNSSLGDIRAAIGRYHQLGPEQIELSAASQKGLLVSLIQRFFTDQLEFINIAKRFLRIDDFFPLLETVIYPPASHGKLGGKSAGLFLAMAILRAAGERFPELSSVKSPRTWYIVSDGLVDFIRLNSLEEVHNQKYVEIDQARREYPHIVQIFKNSRFSSEMQDKLSVLLDDLEGKPIIVRSSSLLEDRLGAAFSGKYKSLFLANEGTKRQRLAALTDAIAEVYASIFGPDPIEYRAERGLLDMHEEMGIMIQEVVGQRVGPYFLPAYAGVGFSHNEFRWSHRIKREDGLLRVVPGLGTRAVDRVKDDYPILLAPGQPGLRVNISAEEVLRYSPKKIDVINLETGAFETIDAHELLRDFGREYPAVHHLVSIVKDHGLAIPPAFGPDFERDEVVITCDGLVRKTPFMQTMRQMISVLEEALETPVDIEFASDGTDLYLLQCRPQSHAVDSTPTVIPKNIPPERVIFTAERYVSNGRVPVITHIVYVDPDRYNEISELDDLKAVGKAVGRLNNLLPKRQFILMGPGRWGSRGDIKLGVNVTYSDINNTAMLIEVARKKGSYVPDLSFGTHFFQDLVESGIRYLPLYPGDEGIIFNEVFLARSPSILARLLPEFDTLAGVIRVIDVPQATGGLVLRVCMNADQDQAISYLAPPSVAPGDIIEPATHEEALPEHHWRWRMWFAERIAGSMDPRRFGVQAMYLLGSTKNASAGPASDIDLLIHFRGDEEQRSALMLWLEGWSRCLAEVNFVRTGYTATGLLDIHIITDEDIAARDSFAVKIGAITDPARPLVLGRDSGDESISS